MADWYYDAGGKPDGPHSDDDIVSLLLTGQVNKDTLVWRDGQEGWTALSKQPEFSGQFKPVPPPLPPKTPMLPQPTDEMRVPYGQAVEPEEGDDHDVTPEQVFAREPIFVGNKNAALYAEGGPWSRFFARLIDTLIFVFGLVIALSYGLAYLSPELSIKWVVEADPRANYFIALPFAFFLNSVLITLFGNSIGKAIFGLHVEPLSGERLGFVGNLRREFRVYSSGYCFGIPIANLFTFWQNFRQISIGKPALFDAGEFHIKQRAGGFRVFVGILIALACVAGGVMWNTSATQERNALLSVQAWTNPVTNKATRLPAGYVSHVQQADDGTTLYVFINMVTGIQAIMAIEPSSVTSADLKSYSEALASTIRTFSTLGAFYQIPGSDLMQADGAMKENQWPTSTQIRKVGDALWRIILIDTTKSTGIGVVQPDLTRALWKTVDP